MSSYKGFLELRREPFFSPLSCGITLIFLLGLAGLLIFTGAQIFSPGPLTAVRPQNRPLQRFTSHADFENRCYLCHTPLLGPAAERCLACHLAVAGQLKADTGLHAVLANAGNCVACHLDHRGREVRITRINAVDFPHQPATGFTLARHQTGYDGLSIECGDCHLKSGYDFDQAVCLECHIEAQPVFMTDHQLTFGQNCLACHDGERPMPFDHAAFFPLEGEHTTLNCANCHGGYRFKGTPRECYGCHAAKDVHNSQLGTECGACHTPRAWSEVILEEHTFPITHRNEGRPIECQVCHPAVYTVYTCYGCHEHNPTKMERRHLEEGIRDFQNCAACHPTGREDEAEDD
ncbi:MAG: hypothetical protein AB1801_15925 [Chloroflexota bacterium]